MANVFQLPANVEAERCVLGAMMISPQACAVALGSLEEDNFSDVDPRNRMIFHAMKELSFSGKPIDVNTVFDEIISLQLNKEVTAQYLGELLNLVISPDNVDDYIAMVHEQAVLRDFLLEMKSIQEEYAKGVPNIGEFIEKSNASIGLIAQKRVVKGMVSAADVANTVGVKIQQSSTSNVRGLIGIDTGFRELNALTHGWQKEDLIILAARPSVGKTALGLNFAFNAASKSKCTVAFFSLEMSSEKIMERLLASRSSVNSEKIMQGFLDQRDKVKLAAAIDEISKTRLYCDDSPDSKLGDIISKATQLKNQHPDLGLIVIDYLGRIRMSDRTSLDQRQQEVSIISGQLKQLARSLHVPVICLAQLNRDVEKTETKKPQLSNLRESGAIEQDADVCILLYREDYYTNLGISVTEKKKKFGQQEEAPKEEAPKKNQDVSEVSLIIAKNRNGKTGECKLIFQKNFSRFSDPSREFESRQAEIEAGRLQRSDE